MRRTGGFKEAGCLGIQQELAKTQKAAEEAWTTLSAYVGCINPPEVAVAVCSVPDLFGGRPASDTNEHATPHGGRSDE